MSDQEGSRGVSEESYICMVELFLNEGAVLQNRYKVDSLISSTGFGQVYKALDIRFPGKWWAVKVFKGIPLALFNKEAKTLTLLNHPHLVKVVDFFQEKDNLCLVMEYIGGRSLDRILDQTAVPLPERQVLSWGIQCADALLCLHSQLKQFPYYKSFSPRKILISTSGEVKLVPEFFECLQSKGLPGVMGFASPEAFDESQIPDETSDLYSLAAVLHRCLAGENPGAVPFVFVPISTVNPRIVSSIERVLEKATQNDPRRRYSGLEDFRKELYRCFQEVLKIQPQTLRMVDKNMSIWWLVMALSGMSIMLWLYFFL